MKQVKKKKKKKVKDLSGKEGWLRLSGFGVGVEALWFPREFVTISLHLKLLLPMLKKKKPWQENKNLFQATPIPVAPSRSKYKTYSGQMVLQSKPQVLWRKKALPLQQS